MATVITSEVQDCLLQKHKFHVWKSIDCITCVVYSNMNDFSKIVYYFVESEAW